MDLGLEDKFALVTASSQGVGKATALALAQEGATVAICSRKKAAIEHTAAEIREQSGSTILPLVADVSKSADIKRLVNAVKKQFGTIHILVNNAGGPPTGDILTMTDEEWQRGFELTLMSAVRLTRQALPMMIKQQWGRIITITSITSKQPITDLILSSVFRPGISGLTRVLSNKYAVEGVTFNTVSPGMILTNRQKEIMSMRSSQQKISSDEYMAAQVKDIPAGRMGNPEEIGNVIAFLASEQANYINGVNLLVDGGLAKGIA